MLKSGEVYFVESVAAVVVTALVAVELVADDAVWIVVNQHCRNSPILTLQQKSRLLNLFVFFI